MQEDIRKVKALSLIIDWTLWPRYEKHGLDRINVGRMKETLESSGTLPPILVDIDSNRVVDGFHRIAAYRKVFGDGVEVLAEFKKYENESEIFRESARINSRHGSCLTAQDKVHCLLKMIDFGETDEVISETLSITKKCLQGYRKRTAYNSDNEAIPLTAPVAAALNQKWKQEECEFEEGEKVLTKKEDILTTGKTGGLPVGAYLTFITHHLNAGTYPLFDEQAETLKEFIELANTVLVKYNKNKKVGKKKK